MTLYGILRPALFALDAERAHEWTIRALKLAGGRKRPDSDPRLTVDLAGLMLDNPIGLAAGFDKNAECPDGLFALGFGMIEVGTITPRAQAGNDRPRIFRLVEDEAVINRLGFNNDGMEAVADRLDRRGARAGDDRCVLGINVGANKDSDDRLEDYSTAIGRLAPYADYLTLNVSSPNTPGLRSLQSADRLARLIALAIEARNDAMRGRPCPLFLKLAPDLTDDDVADLSALALTAGVDALIISNTTVERSDSLSSPHREETGGLSGRPLFERSTALLSAFYRETTGRIPLVGVGGIFSAEDAYAKICAGATAIQLYTGLIYKGPGLVRRLKSGLVACLERDGLNSIADAVGRHVNR